MENGEREVDGKGKGGERGGAGGEGNTGQGGAEGQAEQGEPSRAEGGCCIRFLLLL